MNIKRIGSSNIYEAKNGLVIRPSISFSDVTRTLTITGSHKFYVESSLFTNNNGSIIIPDTEGIHVIYYGADNQLHSIANPTHEQFEDFLLKDCSIAVVYWDAANNKGLLFDERHGSVMSSATHRTLHEVIGARWERGLSLGDFIVDASGNVNTHAQFSVAEGHFYDEDIDHTTIAVASTIGLQIFYLDGANWRWTTNNGYSVLNAPAGRLYYNNNGALTEVTNGDFVFVHVFAINTLTNNVVAVMGQNKYSTISTARDNALIEINTVKLDGLPSKEMVPIGTIIFQTNDTYTNAVKARIRTTDIGENYVDWRSTRIR
jgi:hypothetical protein